MFDTDVKLILSQRYIRKADGSTAMLLDICGNEAIVELEKGQLLKVPTDSFKNNFIHKY